MTAIAAGAAILGGCTGNMEYDSILAEMNAPLPADPQIHDLVRYAALAANGHNTQPWKFRAETGGIRLFPDFERGTPIVDPDDHHLFASLGCAAENLSLAAKAHSLSETVAFDGAAQTASVELAPAPPEESDLFAAIPKRQCTRSEFDGRQAEARVTARLAEAAGAYGVEAILLTDTPQRERILELVVAGNSAQVDDPAFVAELKHWMRFNTGAAAAARDGIFSGSSGSPTAPTWLGSIMFSLFFTKDAENERYVKQIRSSAGVVIFVAPSDDPAGWFAAGRAYQRFALQATALGLKNSLINQAVEVPQVRAQLRSEFGIAGRRPNLIARFGYGPEMPKSLRRPVDDVIS